MGMKVNQNDPTIAKKHPNHAKGGSLLNGNIYRDMPARNLETV